MKRRFSIKRCIAKGVDQCDILASNILGQPVRLTEQGRNALLKMVLELESRESIVLTFLYLLSKPCTQREIGDMLHVTNARIGQIEQKAMRKLKHPSRIRILRLYIKASSAPAA